MIEILLSRELAALGMDRQLRGWHARGTVTRIVPGAYVRTAELDLLDADSRYRLHTVALARLYPHSQFSHDSAAAMWRLPTLGAWPKRAHVATAAAAGGRSTELFIRHGTGLDPDAVEIDGARVSSLARTLAEVSAQRSFGRAVVMLDDGLRRHDETEYRYRMPVPTKAQLLHHLSALGKVPGYARAARAIDFADGRSASPGESLGRAQMRALGIPAPELQVTFHDAHGRIGDVDYWWPELGIAGEFDGNSKYGDARRYSQHLTPEEVLVAEKRREDRLRRVVAGLVRWDWSVVVDRRALGTLLAGHGIVAPRPTRRG